MCGDNNAVAGLQKLPYRSFTGALSTYILETKLSNGMIVTDHPLLRLGYFQTSIDKGVPCEDWLVQRFPSMTVIDLQVNDHLR